jgi:hypothetical protein
MAPAASGPNALDATTANTIMGANKLFIQQKFSLAEAVTGGCCEVSNKYVVVNQDNGEKMFEVKEKGNKWNRCCCAPCHSFTLQFRPANGDDNAPPVMTVERQGCCGKWLCCFACGSMCNDGANYHAGYVDPEKIGEIPRDTIFGYSAQPTCGGVFTPTINIMDGNALETTPYAKIEGPFIFGGCSELCCDFSFPISKFGSESKTGDLAVITKQKPKSMKDAAKEAFGDSDMFIMEFKDPSLTAAQKASLLSSLFLLDFMFFELDNGMISCQDGGLVCTLCLCYCCGCLLPCNLKVGGGGGGGE